MLRTSRSKQRAAEPRALPYRSAPPSSLEHLAARSEPVLAAPAAEPIAVRVVSFLDGPAALPPRVLAIQYVFQLSRKNIFRRPRIFRKISTASLVS